MTNINQQLDKIRNQPGFIAALDQSGGSTPKALANYGVGADAYSNDDEMFEVVHNMRSRIVTSPAFSGSRIMGAILFENTMDREVKGQGTADYLWNVKAVVPFLKVDKGLVDEAEKYRARSGIYSVYEIEACPACGWNHRRRRYSV